MGETQSWEEDGLGKQERGGGEDSEESGREEVGWEGFGEVGSIRRK